MTWKAEDPQGNESAKVRWDIVRYTRGKGLDVGCGPNKALAYFVGVDSTKDTSLFGIEMRPDVVAHCDDLPFEVDSQDFVFSSHLLEHMENTHKALLEWWRVLKHGGNLVLYLPHKELYPNIGQPGSNPDHKHDFLPVDIIREMRRLFSGWTLLVNETRSEGLEYSFLQVYRKDREPGHREPWGIAPKGKRACVVRYGGYGDQLQAASIFPTLKSRGYHVTLMTLPGGKDLLAGNPYVDDWIVQDPDQVPNADLYEFWEAQAKHYHRFINLSESVEATLLAMPGRANHGWPDAMRRKYLNQNYLEFTAELAELPYVIPERVFYPTEEEVSWAKEFVSGMQIPVMFVLSGSVHHKFYPHQDEAIAQILALNPGVHVITTGDIACQILECGLEQLGDRVHLSSDKFGIRKTLALAQLCALVVGPETGVMNAVAFEAVAKVILLSHSSVNNLPRDWRNTVALEPEKTPCYPCHRLHFGRKFCPEHQESGAAICAWNIRVERVVEAAGRLLQETA